MRLKQRVLERRSSPLVRRKERSHIKRRSYLASTLHLLTLYYFLKIALFFEWQMHLLFIKRNYTHVQVCNRIFPFSVDGSGSAGSTPDSGPNSPPINCGIVGTPQSGSGGGTPQHDDSGGSGGSPYGHSAYGPTNSVCDLTLYSSPSLPNISLGARVPHSLTLGRPIPPNSVRFLISQQLGVGRRRLYFSHQISYAHVDNIFSRKVSWLLCRRLKYAARFHPFQYSQAMVH